MLVADQVRMMMRRMMTSNVPKPMYMWVPFDCRCDNV
jgi:hypothetical protein